jgi:hypothetical protein
MLKRLQTTKTERSVSAMALTRDFKDTIKARAQRDPEFRIGLLQEALDAFISADRKPARCSCAIT